MSRLLMEMDCTMMISELVLGMYTCFCTSITQVLYEVLYEYCTIICISTVRALYEYCAKSLYEYYPNTTQLEPGMTWNYRKVTALGRVIGTACTTLLDVGCRETRVGVPLKRRRSSLRRNGVSKESRGLMHCRLKAVCQTAQGAI